MLVSLGQYAYYNMYKNSNQAKKQVRKTTRMPMRHNVQLTGVFFTEPVHDIRRFYAKLSGIIPNDAFTVCA